MNITFDKGTAVISGLSCFEPRHIFDNGQAFRFAERDGCYEGVAHGRFCV